MVLRLLLPQLPLPALASAQVSVAAERVSRGARKEEEAEKDTGGKMEEEPAMEGDCERMEEEEESGRRVEPQDVRPGEGEADRWSDVEGE